MKSIYTWSRLPKLMYSCLNSKVYRKRILQIDVFLFNLRSIVEVDFHYWCISFENQKCTWSRFPKSIIPFQTQKYTWSILHFRKSQEVLLDYIQSTFLFLSVFILHLYFFLKSSLKAYFYCTSRIWSINEVYLKYT